MEHTPCVTIRRSYFFGLPRIRQLMLGAHQYGVAIPGGAEILVHARSVLEETVRSDPGMGVWAFIDVDLVNCFPSLEWDDIDESMAEALPEIAGCTHWCHEEPGNIHLPSGGVHRPSRGAEQGDPHGPLQAGLVLARRVRQAMRRLTEARGGKPGCFTWWFADDGQAICRPHEVDGLLCVLDEAITIAGGTRGCLPDAKSVVRLVGHSTVLAEFDALPVNATWVTERVRNTCHVPPPNSDTEVLGAIVGTPAACNKQFLDTVNKLTGLHDELNSLDDAPVELVLGRKCADVSRVTYLMRLMGHRISPETAKQHDREQHRYLENVFGGGLHDTALTQAAAGVREGGLGFRSAAQLRLPAFIASRVEARPFVRDLFENMFAAGVVIPGCMERYDAHIATAVGDFIAGLPSTRAEHVREQCDVAGELAERRFNAFVNGRREDSAGAPVGNQHAGDRLVAPPGAEDDEHPLNVTFRLQHRLARISDEESLDRLSETLVRREEWSDVRRIRELRHDTCSHEWLWAIGPGAGGTLDPEDYVTAVRLRLGASHTDEPVPCRSCGRTLLDPRAYHALCCACGPSTKGHNAVRDVILDFTRLADATAEPEVLGLIASAPGLRPADILTSALAVDRDTALDVGVAAPDASGAGDDCTESMRKRKHAKYAPFAQDLAAAGVVYRPLVWSCFGREHAETTTALVTIARRVARRQGLADHRPVLNRIRAAVGVALARRCARMVHSCLRRPGRVQTLLR